VQWCTPVIPALRRLRQEDLKFRAGLEIHSKILSKRGGGGKEHRRFGRKELRGRVFPGKETLTRPMVLLCEP
jgi:hypothetical protein